jgi:hypothetical protein
MKHFLKFKISIVKTEHVVMPYVFTLGGRE